MHVQNILAEKSVQTLLWLTPDSDVAAAAKMMEQNRVGSLIVSEDGKKLAGILSERDIVREVARRGSMCLSLPIKDIMTSKVITCTPTDTTDHILQTMTDGRFRHMPVVENDEVTGLISIGDVVKARLMQVSMEKQALEGMIMGH